MGDPSSPEDLAAVREILRLTQAERFEVAFGDRETDKELADFGGSWGENTLARLCIIKIVYHGRGDGLGAAKLIKEVLDAKAEAEEGRSMAGEAGEAGEAGGGGGDDDDSDDDGDDDEGKGTRLRERALRERRKKLMKRFEDKSRKQLEANCNKRLLCYTGDYSDKKLVKRIVQWELQKDAGRFKETLVFGDGIELADLKKIMGEAGEDDDDEDGGGGAVHETGRRVLQAHACHGTVTEPLTKAAAKAGLIKDPYLLGLGRKATQNAHRAAGSYLRAHASSAMSKALKDMGGDGIKFAGLVRRAVVSWGIANGDYFDVKLPNPILKAIFAASPAPVQELIVRITEYTLSAWLSQSVYFDATQYKKMNKGMKDPMAGFEMNIKLRGGYKKGAAGRKFIMDFFEARKAAKAAAADEDKSED